MTGSNHKPPLPFPGAAPIPIVGQPCRLLAFVPNVLLQCACDAKTPMLAVGQGAIVRCPSCHRAFVVAEIAFHAQTNQVSVKIAQVFTPDEAKQLEPAGPM